MKDYMGDYVHNKWSKRVNFNYRNGTGLHRYYVIINCIEKKLSFEFHHLKKSLISRVCGKSFYETIDIPGTPPKKYMDEFMDMIRSECIYQFKCHQQEWSNDLIPDNLY